MAAAPPQHLSLCSVKFCCSKLRTEKNSRIPSILCLTHLLAILHYPKAFKSFFFFCSLMKSLQIVYMPMFGV